MKKIKYGWMLVLAFSLLLIPGYREVQADALPGYGADISEYEVKSTKDALAKYKKKKVYKIKPSTAPIKKSKFRNYTTYNKNTKNYYTIRSYMEEFEEKKGGTLVLKKGTYKITNTIYVPSNTTIILEKGVKIVKATKTGTKKIKASDSLFQFITPKKSGKKSVLKKYNGSKNINIIGVANATVDLKSIKNAMGFMFGHNQNVVVSGITFQNLNSGHFLEVDATKNMFIDHCTFKNAKEGSRYIKEAINLDTPDKLTQGFHCKWSSMDKTPNTNITISNCIFTKLGRAIGTHNYSAKGDKQMMHTNIKVVNNMITDMYNDGSIRVMNWKNCTIMNNTITDVQHKSDSKKNTTCRGILFSGTNNVTVTKNYVTRCGRAFQYMAWKNDGDARIYPVISDVLTPKNKTDLSDNHAETLYSGEYFTRITTEYEVYSNAEKIPFTVGVSTEETEYTY